MNLIPFELHLTTHALAAHQVDDFVAICQQLGAKALLIELAQGQVMQQPMLSKVALLPDVAAALTLAAADAASLKSSGFAVSRTKLEVPATHAAYLAATSPGPAGTPYFEWHGKVSYVRAPELLAVCARHQAHLSANALKDSVLTRFVTLREYGPLAVFEQRVAELVQALQAHWPIQKQQAEYCLYDSNTGLDQGWLPS